jgi:ArsR family transcriptional regulator, arsenate/arsenite/antimonite-responsive transcriptional repressor
MDENHAIKALAALAQPNRLRIFRQLVVAGQDGMTPGTLGDALDVAPATLSFHLKELLNSGLILQERDGRHLIYRAQVENMNGLLAYLTDNCCQGESCLEVTTINCKC